MHAEAMLLVDDDDAKIVEHDTSSEIRACVPIRILSSPDLRLSRIVVALAAAFAAGEQRERNAGGLRQRARATAAC